MSAYFAGALAAADDSDTETDAGDESTAGSLTVSIAAGSVAGTAGMLAATTALALADIDGGDSAGCVVAMLVPVPGNRGTNSKATILIILIKGLIAGPAVSL